MEKSLSRKLHELFHPQYRICVVEEKFSNNYIGIYENKFWGRRVAKVIFNNGYYHCYSDNLDLLNRIEDKFERSEIKCVHTYEDN